MEGAPYKVEGERPRPTHVVLRCYGHYGYANGWTNSNYCGSCPHGFQCLQRTGAHLASPDIEVAQNHLSGKTDRIENHMRYADPGIEINLSEPPRKPKKESGFFHPFMELMK